jgi:hypothetical protein
MFNLTTERRWWQAISEHVQLFPRKTSGAMGFTGVARLTALPSWQKKIALLLRASRNSAMVMVDQEVNR